MGFDHDLIFLNRRKMCAEERSATLRGYAAAASSRQGCRGATLGERARRLRHLQARIRPRQERYRSALLSNLRGGQCARPAAVHPHRPPASWPRMGPRFPHHVLLYRDGELRPCGEVPETPVWTYRVGSLVDSVYSLPVGSCKTPKLERSTDSIAPPV